MRNITFGFPARPLVYGTVFTDEFPASHPKVMYVGGRMWLYLTGPFAGSVVGPISHDAYMRPLDME
jgi:hypothetical protein